MVIWINGAFGSGKTQTANEICRRLEGAFLYDPENAGYFLRKNEPLALQAENFQDEPLWREINFHLLRRIATEYDGTVVVPMTLICAEYYHQIISALRQEGIQVFHVVLSASRKVLLHRLHSRLEGRNSWAAHQIEGCMAAFENPLFEHKINTDTLTIPEVAERVAQYCNVQLKPRQGGALRQYASRVITQMRYIRK